MERSPGPLRHAADRPSSGLLRRGVYSNGAEEFFSRLCRAEIGHHHHIAGAHLVRYAQEATWREDHRRVDSGRQVQRVMSLAMACKPSVDWCGHRQRVDKAV
jgi:ISXO2-like transposase domain